VQLDRLESDFLHYVVTHHVSPGARLPALTEIGSEMGVSVGKLREQLAVARGLGVVSVRPRLGIQREPFDFSAAVLPSLLFGMATGEAHFTQFSQLRRGIETAFWDEAVVLLTTADKRRLRELVTQAWAKLHGDPIHVPNSEHRQLHLTIFSRLDNPFVQGLLTAYWDAYEASELTRFVRYQYWVEVWTYHERIVAAIECGDFAAGRQLLIEHFSLLPERPGAAPAPSANGHEGPEQTAANPSPTPTTAAERRGVFE
jgi:DNA-binding FadR family transcriptional regulator